MKTLKVKSILFSLFAIMAVAVFFTSCGKEQVILNPMEQVVDEADNQVEERRRRPCGDTGGMIIPGSENDCCNTWGAVWANGHCWACY